MDESQHVLSEIHKALEELEKACFRKWGHSLTNDKIARRRSIRFCWTTLTTASWNRTRCPSPTVSRPTPP